MKENKVVNVYMLNRLDTDLSTDDTGMIQRFIRANNGRADVVFVQQPEDADLIILFEHFSFKQSTYVPQLLSDTFFQRWASKLFVVNYDDSIRRGFLPGSYVSVPQSCFDPMFHRACVYPKVYNEYLLAENMRRTDCFSTLFSFSGVLSSHPIRKKMFNLLLNHPDGAVREVNQNFHTHNSDQKKRYIEEIVRSLFVLCPRGHSPATYRLFEVMQLGRCPVIISDEWVAPTGIPWDKCSIRIPEDQIDKIPQILVDHMDNAVGLGIRAREVWIDHFSEEKKHVSCLDSLISLQASRIEVGLVMGVEEFRAYWQSKEFRKKSGWTLSQKVTHRLRRLLYC